MKKLKSNQYALRANVSKKTIAHIRFIQATMYLKGIKLTIEQLIERILKNSTINSVIR